MKDADIAELRAAGAGNEECKCGGTAVVRRTSFNLAFPLVSSLRRKLLRDGLLCEKPNQRMHYVVAMAGTINFP